MRVPINASTLRMLTVVLDDFRGGGGGGRMNDDGGWGLMARLRWRIIMGCFLVVATTPNDECGAGVGESAVRSCVLCLGLIRLIAQYDLDVRRGSSPESARTSHI